MKICILSNKGQRNDEGQRNLAIAFAKEFKTKHSVLHLNAKKSLRELLLFKKLKSFSPDIIHFFLRPTLTTIIMAKLCKYLFRNSRVVISSIQPPSDFLMKRDYLLKLLSVDCITTLSEKTGSIYDKIGLKTKRLSCGVDIKKFYPVTVDKKKALRLRYGIRDNKPVVLHVGHLTKGRNLQSLVNGCVSQLPYNLIVVASPMFARDIDVCRVLNQKGAMIIQKYMQNIEEIYQLADVYVFPTMDKNYCIESPLSVLEAMATNLPILTTKFGILPDYFVEGEGIHFVDDPSEISDAVKECITNKYKIVRTREKVFDFTWENAAKGLLNVYKELIDEN